MNQEHTPSQAEGEREDDDDRRARGDSPPDRSRDPGDAIAERQTPSQAEGERDPEDDPDASR